MSYLNFNEEIKKFVEAEKLYKELLITSKLRNSKSTKNCEIIENK